MRTGLSPKVREELALNCINICQCLNINVPLQSLEERQAQAEEHLKEVRQRNSEYALKYYYTHVEECRANNRKRAKNKRNEKDAKYRATCNKAMRKYYAKHREEIAERRRKYYLAHREEILSKRREKRAKAKNKN